MAPLQVAVVGCGHMGAHHARIVATDPGSELAATLDVVPERARTLAARHGGRAVEHLPDDIDVAIVATPTSTHAEVAAPLLERGLWCLVEKPLAHTLSVARTLGSPRCGVGHVERFNPAVRAAGPLAPRYVEARRLAPPSGRATDVDVVLDLMIHDLDLLLSWMPDGSEIAWLDATGVAVHGPGVDTASVRLRTTHGMTASLFASRVADARHRLVRVYEEGRYTRLDLLHGAADREGAEVPHLDPRDALTAQWHAFTDAVREGRPPDVHAESAGLRAVELAERIRGILGERS